MMSPLRKLAVLVVEDNTHMAHIVKAILRAFGIIHIYETKDVAEAFELVRQYAIDVVFLDYNLGFVDGLDFIRMIRTAPDTPNAYLPIIMLTAYSEKHRVLQARDAGATEFCVKPITAIEVYRKMVEVIDNPRPFVRTASYFGPDRRRHDAQDAYAGPERRGVRAGVDPSHAKVG
jgi:CheY-like chemotaxis protein